MTNKRIPWYTYNRMFSHNCFVNLVMSPRGNGKTYGAKKVMIDEFKKTGKQSVYTRRTKTELEETKDTFFDDVAKEYPDDTLEVKGMFGYINGNLFVFFIPLSTSAKLKSKAFPNVKYLFFDEYVIKQTGATRYLKEETWLLLELANTIFRFRSQPTDGKIVLMANAISFVNPLFTYFDIQPKTDMRFQKFQNKMIILEMFKDEGLTKEADNSLIGRLTQGTKYADYAIGNDLLEDSNDFIEPKRPMGYWNPLVAYKSDGFEIQMWHDTITGNIYVDREITNQSQKLSVKIEDNESGWKQLRDYRNAWTVKICKKNFDNCKMFYKNQEIKKFVENKLAPWL